QQQVLESIKDQSIEKALEEIKSEKLEITVKQDNNGFEENKRENSSMKHQLYKFSSDFKKFIGFIGPGYVIAVGYLDPGNWATDLSAGSQFGYTLLFIIFFSNLIAVLMQALSIKLGVVTGMACDLSEVIGSAIALNLLFNIPLAWGVAITALDVILILFLYKDSDMKSAHILESLVMLLVGVVGFCFVLELVYAKPNSLKVLKGFLPTSGIFTNGAQLYNTVKARKFREEDQGIKFKFQNRDGILERNDASTKIFFKKIVQSTIYFSVIDSTVALTFALFVNSAILIVSAANFYYVPSPPVVASLFDAYNLLKSYLGIAAATIFAVGLLFAGQSSTLTATIAGQIVMEGFTDLRMKPWLRRLLTRLLAIVPAMTIVILKGESGLNNLLVASQVALSIQLPFAIVPLIWFTSRKEFMKVDVRELAKRELDDEEVMINVNESENQVEEKISFKRKLSGLIYSDSPKKESLQRNNGGDLITSDERYTLEFSNS
ncbi:212_t:CDS:2, partial [Acaulospora colombiana]